LIDSSNAEMLRGVYPEREMKKILRPSADGLRMTSEGLSMTYPRRFSTNCPRAGAAYSS
jgi:hypothetical protein